MPSGSVCGRWLNEADEVVVSIFVIRDGEQEWCQDLSHVGEVVIGWVARDGREARGGFDKEGRDFFGRHGRMAEESDFQLEQVVVCGERSWRGR
jgi:hypothetical protein